MKRTSSKFSTRMIAGVGIFSALAAVVSFATSFLKVGFLSLDAGDIVIVIASFIYGPVSGVVVSLISALASFLYSGTGFWGFLMDFASSASFVFVASFIYSRKRDFKSAIIGIGVSVITTTLVMMPLNILITPIYTGASAGYVITLIPVLLLPFNFAKTLLNGAASLLIYKPLVRAMRAAKLAPPSKSEPKVNAAPKSHRTSVMSLVLGLMAIVVAIIVLVLINTLTDYHFRVEEITVLVPYVIF